MGHSESKESVEYVAALCHLVDYDSTHFTASSEVEAKRLADGAKSIGTVTEKTWLQVKRYCDSYCIQSTLFEVC
jgi:hypothetical protein